MSLHTAGLAPTYIHQHTTCSALATLNNMSEARHHYPQQDQAHALWRCVALPLRCGLLLLLQLLAGCALPLRFRLVLVVCVFFVCGVCGLVLLCVCVLG